MAPKSKIKIVLDKKFKKIQETPASFAFYLAIHDFVKHIETNTTLSSSISQNDKFNREQRISAKYASLKQIYQGVEDKDIVTDEDLGHERHTVVRDIGKIQKGETFEHNELWKKRETLRKISVQIYERLA